MRKTLMAVILVSLSTNINAEQIFKETIYERYDTEDDATISIRTEKGSETVGINGFALWSQGADGQHVASVDGKAKLIKGVANFADGQCKFTLDVKDKTLVVKNDSGKCGDTGSNFNGKYKKRTFFKNFYKKAI